jgi:pimeloyl-ACP methyl ester carboxylesterase
MSFVEKGGVRIHYEEAGAGFPLLLIAGGGLNSTIAGITGSYAPFNAIEEFKDEYRCVAFDLRNANPGASLPARSRSTGRGMPTPMISSP